jgi:Ca-activated chloride channel family protein
MYKRLLCVIVSLTIIIGMLAACSKRATGSTDSKCDEPVQYNMDIGNEEYAHFEEGTFYNANKQHLSTFSIDVDTASYANIRRMLNDGELPYPDDVRVEECINYFNYDYIEPEGNSPFSINVEMAGCPWQKENYLAMIALHARDIDKTDIVPSNFVF